MGRKVVPVGSTELQRMPDRCRRCLFWELGTPRPIELAARGRTPDELEGDPQEQKRAWWRAAERGESAGPAAVLGRLATVDGDRAGFALVGPREAFAYRRPPVPRPSEDAVLLATAWVEPGFRGQRVGRLLVQAAVKEAVRTERRAVEAYGDRRHRDGACVLPCTWLLHEGFAVHREHPRYPLLRLSVKSTARWAEPLEHAVEQALERMGVSPEPAPQRTGG